MTSIYDINSFDDIKLLWENKIRESHNLEFKADVTKDNKEIAKDISAFANADGGVIIYGVKEDGNGVAVESEGIEINNKRERIQQIVSSSIAPELKIYIEIINAKDKNGKIIDNKGFIVVKIPKSDLYIHQVTYDNRYYVRCNSTTKRYVNDLLSEQDIALRYEKRFANKMRMEDLLSKKEKELVGDYKDGYLFIGIVPYSTLNMESITEKDKFEQLLKDFKNNLKDDNKNIKYNGFDLYPFMIAYLTHSPTAYGRRIKLSDIRPNVLVEAFDVDISNNGSLFSLVQFEQEHFDIYKDIFELPYILIVIIFYMMLFLYKKSNNYFGQIHCKLRYKPPSLSNITLTEDDRELFKVREKPIRDFSKVLNMNPDPVTLDILSTQSLKEIIPDIFDKICKSLGIDNSKVLADSFKQSNFIEALDASLCAKDVDSQA